MKNLLSFRFQRRWEDSETGMKGEKGMMGVSVRREQLTSRTIGNYLSGLIEITIQAIKPNIAVWMSTPKLFYRAPIVFFFFHVSQLREKIKRSFRVKPRLIH